MSKSKAMAGSSEKKKRRSGSSSPKEQSNSLPKKRKTEFTDVKFKFELRSQDTIVSGLLCSMLGPILYSLSEYVEFG